MNMNAASPVSRAWGRPLLGPFRFAPQPGFLASAASPSPTVFETLWLVLGQQLCHDALLLWRLPAGGDRLELAAAAPHLAATDLRLALDRALRDLVNGQLEIVAHTQCAGSAEELQRALGEQGIHAAITAPLRSQADGTYLVTCGFRQRWALVSHHARAVSAFMDYLRACQRHGTFGSPGQCWWGLDSQVPRLWRQLHRPTVLRTVHDLNEVLADAAEQCRPRSLAGAVNLAMIRELAHEAADLMARLEGIYWDPRPMVTVDELLSECVLLVHGACKLCQIPWPGYLVSAGNRPDPPGKSPDDIRHALIEWLLAEVEDQWALAA